MRLCSAGPCSPPSLQLLLQSPLFTLHRPRSLHPPVTTSSVLIRSRSRAALAGTGDSGAVACACRSGSWAIASSQSVLQCHSPTCMAYVPSLLLPLRCTEYPAICTLAPLNTPLPRAITLLPSDLPPVAAATAASVCSFRARAQARGAHGRHVLHGPLRKAAHVRVALLPSSAALDVGARPPNPCSASPALSTTSAHTSEHLCTSTRPRC